MMNHKIYCIIDNIMSTKVTFMFNCVYFKFDAYGFVVQLHESCKSVRKEGAWSIFLCHAHTIIIINNNNDDISAVSHRFFISHLSIYLFYIFCCSCVSSFLVKWGTQSSTAKMKLNESRNLFITILNGTPFLVDTP